MQKIWLFGASNINKMGGGKLYHQNNYNNMTPNGKFDYQSTQNNIFNNYNKEIENKKIINRDLNYSGLGLIIQFSISYIIVIIMTRMFTYLVYSNSGLVSDLILSIYVPLTNSVAMITANLVAFFVISKKVSLSYKTAFSFKNISGKVIFYGFFVCILVNSIGGMIANIFNQFISNAGLIATTPTFSLDFGIIGNIIMVIYIVIIAPVTEELLCRGVLLGTLKRYGVCFGAVFSSLLFAIMHGNIPQMVSAFLGGLFFSYIAIKTNSLLTVILLHSANNLFVLLISLAIFGGNQTIITIINIITLIIVITGIVVVVKNKKKISYFFKRQNMHKIYSYMFSRPAIIIYLALCSIITISSFSPI